MKVKKNYWYYKEKGICVYCKTKKATKGVYCLECSEKRNKDRKARYKYLLSIGRCTQCGYGKIESGKICNGCKYEKKRGQDSIDKV